MLPNSPAQRSGEYCSKLRRERYEVAELRRATLAPATKPIRQPPTTCERSRRQLAQYGFDAYCLLIRNGRSAPGPVCIARISFPPWLIVMEKWDS